MAPRTNGLSGGKIDPLDSKTSIKSSVSPRVYFYVSTKGVTHDRVADITDIGQFPLSKIPHWVQMHANNSTLNTFVSVTSDPLCAINRLCEYRRNRFDDARILVIDGSKLDAENIVECNKLRNRVGETEEDRFNGVFLVWKRVPEHAILKSWTWKNIFDSVGKLFPTVVAHKSYRRTLNELHGDMLKTPRPAPKMPDVMKALVDELKLTSSPMILTQLVIIVMAWSKGEYLVSDYAALRKYFELNFPDEIEQLDYRVYAQACRQFLRNSLANAPDGTETNVDMIKLGMHVARKNMLPPTFEDWKTELLESNCDRVPSKDSFVALMEEAGLVISSAPILRKTVETKDPTSPVTAKK